MLRGAPGSVRSAVEAAGRRRIEEAARVQAWVVRSPARVATAGAPRGPDSPALVEQVELPDPHPGPGEVRVRVLTCGVCRTDLHVAEGDLEVRRSPVVPGHEVVGVVDQLGDRVSRFQVGDRIGIAWLRATCGRCAACRRGAENLCADPRFTGWTDDGGYATLAVVPEAYAYRLPETFDDVRVAPLLCAGIIGYRALLRSGFRPGDRLGIWGFGASGHITAQVAIAMGAELFVVTRDEAARRLALDLGATWVAGPGKAPPAPLDAAITFAPAGETVPEALAALDRGAALAVAGIHMTDIPVLDYRRHLFHERELRSVTANTRADGEAFLVLAGRLDLSLATVAYPFEEADRALADLAAGGFTGAAVLRIGGAAD